MVSPFHVAVVLIIFGVRYGCDGVCVALPEVHGRQFVILKFIFLHFDRGSERNKPQPTAKTKTELRTSDERVSGCGWLPRSRKYFGFNF